MGCELNINFITKRFTCVFNYFNLFICLVGLPAMSLVREEVTRHLLGIRQYRGVNVVNLVTASGDALPIYIGSC